MNKSIAALALATLSFGSASAYLLGELRSERAQTQNLQAQIDELQRARPPQRNPFDRPAPPPVVEDATPPPAPAAPQTARAEPPPPPPAVSVLSEAPVFTAQPARMDRARQLLQDPEYRKAMLTQQKFAMRRMYSDLQEALRLQPQEAEQLMDILAEQQLNQMANAPPMRAGRNAEFDPAEMQKYRQQLQQQQSERDAQIASVLGDAKLQEWQNYQKTLGARSQIRELRTELAEAGMPLREGQIEPLVASIAAEQQWRSQESMRSRGQLNAVGNAAAINRVDMMEQNLETTAEYNRRLHDAAAPYLSSDQLRRFDAHLSEQLEMQRANLQLMRAQQDAVARGDIPAPNVGFRTQAGATMMSVEGIAAPMR